MKAKTVIVTGASTGIGKAIAQLFMEKGSNVVINSFSKERLQDAYEEFGSPENVVMVAGDIGKKEVGQQLIDTAISHFKRLDVLINNAGVFQPKPFLEVQEHDLDQFLSTNLKGTYFASQAAVRQMLKQGEGSIINIGTVLVDHAIANLPATAPISSKGAIHALTRQLAAEFGKNNIKINTIAPGIIRTPLQGKVGVEDADSLAGLHLLGRIGEPEEVAQAAWYLANSEFITGEILNVAGGHTVGHAI
ncbi:3-oxoacyl-[acyl-carrier protein] reductase [Fulvivirga imtechensis AK7]|uniref:3-oxoacyl-[acyl-carrier protein] reductase n=1 Tax=Fulvivirga imtechensis AK7 TaxID=1237149 RepID=L8JL37_9BACT|nr:SDR family oxidoreductase [Fulvivirga imtechensis]ELR69520.1 3-oxoacyl-[acyl-carrier protein] reductase [Fulvivirga imtechensis AK7]